MRTGIEFKGEDGVTLRAWHYQPDAATGPVPTNFGPDHQFVTSAAQPLRKNGRRGRDANHSMDESSGGIEAARPRPSSWKSAALLTQDQPSDTSSG